MTIKQTLFFILLTMPLVLSASMKIDERAGLYQTVGRHAINGDEIWQFNGQLLEGNQSILIASNATGLVALSHENGDELWAWEDQSLQTQFARIQDEKLFVFASPVIFHARSGNYSTLVTLNLVDGKEINRQPLPGQLNSNRFLINPNQQKFFQIQQKHDGVWLFYQLGESIPFFKLTSAASDSIRMLNDKFVFDHQSDVLIYVQEYQYTSKKTPLRAYQLSTGKVLWEVLIDGLCLEEPILSSGKFYLACEDVLYRLEANTGAIEFTRQFTSRPTAIKHINDMLLVKLENSSTLYALDYQTSQARWKLKPKIEPNLTGLLAHYIFTGGISNLALSPNGTEVLMQHNDLMVLIRVADGAHLWQTRLPRQRIEAYHRLWLHNVSWNAQTIYCHIYREYIAMARNTGKVLWRHHPTKTHGDKAILASNHTIATSEFVLDEPGPKHFYTYFSYSSPGLNFQTLPFTTAMFVLVLLFWFGINLKGKKRLIVLPFAIMAVIEWYGGHQIWALPVFLFTLVFLWMPSQTNKNHSTIKIKHDKAPSKSGELFLIFLAVLAMAIDSWYDIPYIYLISIYLIAILGFSLLPAIKKDFTSKNTNNNVKSSSFASLSIEWLSIVGYTLAILFVFISILFSYRLLTSWYQVISLVILYFTISFTFLSISAFVIFTSLKRITRVISSISFPLFLIIIVVLLSLAGLIPTWDDTITLAWQIGILLLLVSYLFYAVIATFAKTTRLPLKMLTSLLLILSIFLLLAYKFTYWLAIESHDDRYISTIRYDHKRHPDWLFANVYSDHSITHLIAIDLKTDIARDLLRGGSINSMYSSPSVIASDNKFLLSTSTIPPHSLFGGFKEKLYLFNLTHDKHQEIYLIDTIAEQYDWNWGTLSLLPNNLGTIIGGSSKDNWRQDTVVFMPGFPTNDDHQPILLPAMSKESFLISPNSHHVLVLSEQKPDSDSELPFAKKYRFQLLNTINHQVIEHETMGELYAFSKDLTQVAYFIEHHDRQKPQSIIIKSLTTQSPSKVLLTGELVTQAINVHNADDSDPNFEMQSHLRKLTRHFLDSLDDEGPFKEPIVFFNSDFSKALWLKNTPTENHLAQSIVLIDIETNTQSTLLSARVAPIHPAKRHRYPHSWLKILGFSQDDKQILIKFKNHWYRANVNDGILKTIATEKSWQHHYPYFSPSGKSLVWVEGSNNLPDGYEHTLVLYTDDIRQEIFHSKEQPICHWINENHLAIADEGKILLINLSMLNIKQLYPKI